MSADRPLAAARPPMRGYLRFLVWAVLIGAAAVLLGYAPTRRLWGEAGIPAMMAGVAIGVIASAAGALPIALSRMRGAPISPTQGLAAMGIRTAAVVVLGLSVGFSGWLDSRPLLIWIALGYVAQLALDVWYAVRGF